MTTIFKIPFATQGDKASIPVEVQPDGSVSYTQGYGYDYERDQVTDPAAKDIERENMNGIFHDITEAIGEIQSFGFPKWGEAGKPYAIRTIVYHENKVWQSKIENNNIEPVAGNEWVELKADATASDVGAYSKTESDQRFQPLGNYQASGYGYSKAESDTKYQPKGNYAPAGSYANKGDSYTKTESDSRYQAKGNYQPTGNYALAGASYTKTESDGRYQLKTNIVDSIYPVGVVIWFAQNKNPNSLFPGTKWTYVGENKTIRLAQTNGADLMTMGGADAIALAVDNLPAHGHTFSANTSSFDYGSRTGATNASGDHSHELWADRSWEVSGSPHGFATKTENPGITGASHTNPSPAGYMRTSALGHQLVKNDGSHSHTFSIGLGSHTHTVSGTTANTGSGSAINITNSYVKLMAWYRSA